MRVVRQLQGVAGQAGDGRRGFDPDLHETFHPESAGGLLGEQQVLGLDPAHRAGELPGQQFDDHPAAEFLPSLGNPGVVVGEDLIERGGRHQIADLGDEVAVQGEQSRHQVGDVAADEHRRVGIVGDDPLQGATELIDAVAQHLGVERHVDTGNLDIGPLAAADLQSAFDLGLQGVQTADGAGDRVLRSAQVVVDDLQEFACPLGDLSDEAGDVVVVEVHLGRTDGSQPVVGAAEFVARDQLVHLAAPVEHHLQQRFQFENACHAGQCGVLADRVAAGDGTLDERPLLAHLGDLGGRHRRHGDLGELSQVQHPVGMVIVHTAGHQTGRVVPNHVQHRESQRFAGERIGAVPYRAGGLGAGPHLHTHALVLNTLAGEGICRLRRGQSGGRRHHQFAARAGPPSRFAPAPPGPRRNLQNLCAQVDSDPVDPEVDLITREDHTQEPGGPADQFGRWNRLTVGRGHHMLGGRRQPHPVHDR